MVKKKIRITIQSLETSFRETKKILSEIDRGIFKQHTPTLNFENFQIYKKVLTPKRLELLRVIKSEKPNNIKGLATVTHRDFKNVYDDVKMLETLGLLKLKKSNSGFMPIVLYDEIDIDIKIPLEMIYK
ncbi:MAG: hypothetical protein ISS82_05965 [Nanoarchaeota archaeon]|nr:hypothetical protein [Nanoarchaeota archaeon]